MGQLIDICGTPIDLTQVKEFQIVNRDYIFCPAYKEVEKSRKSIFSRIGDPEKKFEFVQMVPFGAALSDKERPVDNTYEIKSFQDALTLHVLDGVGKAIVNTANIVTDLLRIDTSGNKQYNILTTGRRTVTLRLRDIPAKVQFLSGKISDVFKNDEIYKFLGEPIAPAFTTIPVLHILEKKHYAFFGGGIDNIDVDKAYQLLLEKHNKADLEKQNKPKFALPTININLPKVELPKINLSGIKFQSPFVFTKQNNEETPALPGKEEDDPFQS